MKPYSIQDTEKVLWKNIVKPGCVLLERIYQHGQATKLRKLIIGRVIGRRWKTLWYCCEDSRSLQYFVLEAWVGGAHSHLLHVLSLADSVEGYAYTAFSYHSHEVPTLFKIYNGI